MKTRIERVIDWFYQIAAIPHGSGNMDGIAAFCESFAKKRGLWVVRDEANNVMIKKAGTAGYEAEPPILLQGHLDMVCQKVPDFPFDFETDPIPVIRQGEELFTQGTTLGGDNGIAVALMLDLLDRNDLSHPPIEAVFTSDEEIGMIGAGKLDFSLLSAKRMINLDAEEDDKVTVSCAGGMDVVMRCPLNTKPVSAPFVSVTLSGLAGGHSGVDIGKGRENALLLAGRFLAHMRNQIPFSLCSVEGGDKTNAICPSARILVATSDAEAFVRQANQALSALKEEIASVEPEFSYSAEVSETGQEAMEEELSERIIAALCTAPQGVVRMSGEINGLVETSLNLGICRREGDTLLMHFLLRSSKESALFALEERLFAFARLASFQAESFGFYPAWEYRKDSPLRELYTRLYQKTYGDKPQVEAIHAGLECGVFAKGIGDLDCISIGPRLTDIHTPRERANIPSVDKIYQLVENVLTNCEE